MRQEIVQAALFFSAGGYQSGDGVRLDRLFRSDGSTRHAQLLCEIGPQRAERVRERDDRERRFGGHGDRPDESE